MARKKRWSETVEAHGVRIRVYERANSSSLWYSVVRNGRKFRKSLKTTDRTLAENRAKAIAQELALANLTGDDLRSPTLGHIFQLYRQEKLPLLSEARIRFAKTHLDLFAQAWGTDLEVSNLSPSHVARYVAGRRSGALSPDLKGREVTGVRDGTIDGDFKWLRSVFQFARRHEVAGRPAGASGGPAGRPHLAQGEESTQTHRLTRAVHPHSGAHGRGGPGRAPPVHPGVGEAHGPT